MGGTAFLLQWPSEARPASIAVAYDSASGVIRLHAPAGTLIRAGVAGQIRDVGANFLTLSSGLYTVRYSNLRALRAQAGQSVSASDVIAESAGPDLALTITQALDPTALLVMPTAPPPQPTPSPAETATPGAKSYVVPIQAGLRVREKPVDGNTLGYVGTFDVMEALEPAADVAAKLGKEGEWLKVKTMAGLTGFSAGKFLQAYTGPYPPPAPAPIPGALNITGMNLDMNHPLGRPDPARLKGMGWIRVKLNVSYNPANNTYGNRDVRAAVNRTLPFLEPYVKAGLKVIMVFTHQLYGEGAGFLWPAMDSGKWNELIPTYADFAKQAVSLLKPTGLIHAYQIWNEQDTEPANARAAVPIPAADYGRMLGQTIRAIKAADPGAICITGGHVGGPGRGPQYARATLAAMPADVRPDGIASHPYGRGVRGHMFSPFGPLDEEIRNYGAVMPGKPVWFTEWGVLDQQGNNGLAPQVMDYARGFMNIIKSQYANQVACAVWYAWADSMDNGYGLVDAGDQPKGALLAPFLKL
jgi:hypothetical protein